MAAERYSTGILFHGLEDPISYLKTLGAGLILLTMGMVFWGAFGDGARRLQQQAEVLPGEAGASLEASWPSRSSREPQDTRQGEQGTLVFVGQISVTFAPTATVGEANAALARVGGRVVQSSAASQRQLEVRVSQELAPFEACRLLRGQPGVVAAVPRTLSAQENPFNRR